MDTAIATTINNSHFIMYQVPGRNPIFLTLRKINNR